uniref:Uncharacterized protein n=1 Tax=Romanomermis culicivorax TaxID=13658 RepID=A0A915JGF1_ROMCU
MLLICFLIFSINQLNDAASTRLPDGWVRNIDAAILYSPDIVSSEQLYQITLEKAVQDLRDSFIVPINATFK